MSRIISLEDNIVYISGENKNGRITIEKQNLTPTAVNFENQSLKAEDIAQALAPAVEKNKLKNKKISLMLPTKTALYRELTVAIAKNPKQQAAIIRNEASLAIADIDNYVCDYTELYRNPAENTVKVQFAAMPKIRLESFLDAFESYKIKCEKIDVLASGILKMTNQYYPFEVGKPPIYIVLRINESTVGMEAVFNGVCLLPRNVRLSVARFKSLDTLDVFADELLEHVSKILQYLSARRYNTSQIKLLVMSNVDYADTIIKLLAEREIYECSAFEFGTDKAAVNRQFCTYAGAVGALL